MFGFHCPRCGEFVEAARYQSEATCEACGERHAVPDAGDVETLTLAELAALRARQGLAGSRFVRRREHARPYRLLVLQVQDAPPRLGQRPDRPVSDL